MLNSTATASDAFHAKKVSCMRITTAQPYFAPYPGYFSKIAAADTLVLLDDVQFPRGTTWISRNRFKNDQGVLWMTIPVWRKGQGLQRIRDVRICYEGQWARKHLMALKMAYTHAPYRSEHLAAFATALGAGYRKLFDLNLALIRHVLAYLKIDTPVIQQSQIGAMGKGSSLLIDICRRMGASFFLAQTPARKFLDITQFQQAGIRLEFMQFPNPVYPQLWGDFIPNLSIWDLLFNCGPRAAPLICTGPP